MVTEIRLYIEGGGSEEATKRQLRRGFHRFLGEINTEARRKGISFKPITCGSQNETFEIFSRALVEHPKAINLLLVDSDRPVSTSRLGHIRTHFKRHWKGLGEDRCHLMVQVMEAWFLADLQVLKSFYSQGFNENTLPKSGDVETVPKDTLLADLKVATRRSRKGEYDKIEHASKLLAMIRSEVVRKASRHCDCLFKALEEAVQAVI
jgi:hypothetical protein